MTDTKKLETATLELRATKQELEQLKRTTQRDRGNQSRGDVRLNRALEELDKYKALLHEHQNGESERRDGVRRDNDSLLRDNQRLERQKTDLIAAFRKQMKLIDILKRQKVRVLLHPVCPSGIVMDELQCPKGAGGVIQAETPVQNGTSGANPEYPKT